jgi:hypothetical protein
MKTHGKKKGLIITTVVVSVLMGAAAFAYFTSGGSGTGTAQTGSATNVSISQIGAGYDSLISSNTYQQDQCFACAQITEFGNDITLANPGAQELATVVVALRNWGPAITALPMTLSINNTVGGPISDTENFNIPAAIIAGSDPSTTDVTFNFTGQGAYVEQEFVYGITFDPSLAGALNVALASSATNLAVGTDTHPGTVYVDTAAGPGIDGDFPSCTTPGVGFAVVTTNCGPSAGGNPGAYGTTAQVAAGSADIPAVEVNVVGGIVPPLYPGGPAQPIGYAITNPGSTPVHVGQVTTSVSSLSNTGSNGAIEACASSMYPIVNGGPVNSNVNPGTTMFAFSGTSISMTDDGNNQDNCENAVVHLGFSSN